VEKQPVIVAGMHRSGTSLVAQLLFRCGLSMGPERAFLPANPDNPSGYWEINGIDVFGNRILEQFGGSWDQVPQALHTDEWLDDLDLHELQSEALELLSPAISRDKPWGWKDPRNSILLPFWKTIFPELKLVVCLRNPLEVAFSLSKREWSTRTFQESLKLWRDYYEILNEHLAGSEMIVTHYESHFWKPEAELARICDFVGLSPDKTTRMKTIKDTVQQSNYRGVATDQMLKKSEDLPEGLLALYLDLCEKAGDIYQELSKDRSYQRKKTKSALPRLLKTSANAFDEFSLQITSLQNGVRQTQDELASALQRLDVSEEERSQSIERLEQARSEVTEITNRLDKTTDELSETKSRLDETEVQLSETKSRLDEKENQLAIAQNRLEETRAQRDQTNKLLDEVETELQRTQDLHDETQQLLEQSRARRKAIRMQVQQLALMKEQVDAGIRISRRSFWGRMRSLVQSARRIPYFIKMRLRYARVFKKIRNVILPHRLFDEDYYRGNRYDIAAAGVDAYQHYRKIGWKEGSNPNPFFDVKWYLSNYPDVAAAGVEPLLHYCFFGWKEMRDPGPGFTTSRYLYNNKDVADSGLNPLYHYIKFGRREGRYACPREDHQEIQRVAEVRETVQLPESSPQQYVAPIQRVSREADDVEVYEAEIFPKITNPAVNLIAFYLPQFHPIPENDEFWGRGFTEWTNVSKAFPLFEGHYQPRLPGELGFYDLRVVDVMKRQAALARQYGISGFCFHYYWFNGKKVLDTPIEQFIASPDIDIRFCINWANENWTRRWDGADEKILLSQNHSPADDLAFIADVVRYFRDPRYIRIDGKPLLILYNPQRLPDPHATARRWREYCQGEGFDGLFLVAAQTFGFTDPIGIGFDAAVEFPPHNIRSYEIKTDSLHFFEDFKGTVYDYQSMTQNYKNVHPEFPLLKTVSPDWDNTARRGSQATVYLGSTPKHYQDWLDYAISTTMKLNAPGHQFVFINAWNEWGESAYLEPDRKFGYAYLNATARALEQESSPAFDLLFVASTLDEPGISDSLSRMVDSFSKRTDLKVRILIEDGNLPDNSSKFNLIRHARDIAWRKMNSKERAGQLDSICGPKLQAIYIHEIPSDELLQTLSESNLPIVCRLSSKGDAGRLSRFPGTAQWAYLCDEGADFDLPEGAIHHLIPNPTEVDDARSEFLNLLSVLWVVSDHQPKVSIIVPCYNHARFLRQRLDSIFDQTFQDFEVILMDDASTDETSQILTEYANRFPNVSVHVNEENSGSPFKQWVKGILKARANIIWIAEDDDFCKANLLEALLPAFKDHRVKLAYAASNEVDLSGENLGAYDGYLGNISDSKWKQNYSNPAYKEIQEALSSYNTIPNVSAVLFRKFEIESIIDSLLEYDFAGDWFFYLHAIQWGNVYFHAEPLNYHRRHPRTAMKRAMSSPKYFQELAKIHEFVTDNFILQQECLQQMLHRVKTEWRALFPDRPVEELDRYYPVKDLERRIQEADFQRARRIMVVISGFYFGGAEVFPIRLANYFANVGHHTCIYNSNVWETNPIVKNIVSPLVKILEAPDRNVSEHFRNSLIHEGIEFLNSQGWEADRFVIENIGDIEIPWIASLHGHHETMLSGEVVVHEFPAMMPKIIERVDKFVYVHPKNRAVFNKYPLREEQQAIQTGLLGLPSELPQPASRAELGIAQGDFVLGMTARGIPEKGWEEAIRCVQILNESFGDRVHLLLLGDSPYVEMLKAKYEGNTIHFLGYSAGLVYNQICDVGLLPTFYTSETHPVTIVEHLACGNPVLSTDVGHIAHMLDVDGEKAGFILDLADDGRPDPDEMARFIARYLDDPTLLARHRELARRAFRKFDMKLTADEYLRIFEACREKS
jgi:glycosyltransferase involved in cell wall biosynthesis